jgi:hypothetical protein
MTDRTALETADDWRNDPIKVANCYNTPKYLPSASATTSTTC